MRIDARFFTRSGRTESCEINYWRNKIDCEFMFLVASWSLRGNIILSSTGCEIISSEHRHCVAKKPLWHLLILAARRGIFCHGLVWFGAAIYSNFGFQVEIQTCCTELDERVTRESAAFRDMWWLFVHKRLLWSVAWPNEWSNSKLHEPSQNVDTDSYFTSSMIHLFGVGKKHCIWLID